MDNFKTNIGKLMHNNIQNKAKENISSRTKEIFIKKNT